MSNAAASSAPLLDQQELVEPIQRRVRPRIKTAGYPSMQVSPEEHYAGKLTTLQRGAWSELRMHLWLHGSLPKDAKGLADVAGVHIRTWSKIASAIMPHFDIDEHGRWRHFDMEEAREKRAKQSEVNRQNATKRYEKDATGDASRSSNGANFAAENGPDGDVAAVRPASGSRASDGLTDCSLSYPLEEKTSVSQSVTHPDASDDRCAREADRSPNRSTIGAADAASERSEPPAKAMANSPISDDEIGEVVRRAVRGGGGTLDSGWQSADCLRALRALMAEGVDIEKHYEPALRDFVERVKDKRVRNPAYVSIMKAARERLQANTTSDLALVAANERLATRPDLSTASAETKKLHRSLEAALGTDMYMSWCTRLDVVAIADGVMRIAVPTKFLRTKFRTDLADQLLNAARSVRAEVGARRDRVTADARRDGRS